MAKMVRGSCQSISYLVTFQKMVQKRYEESCNSAIVFSYGRRIWGRGRRGSYCLNLASGIDIGSETKGNNCC